MTTRSARPPAGPKAGEAPAADDGILRIGETEEEPRYEVMFYLEGRPVEVLANPSGSLMIRYLTAIRTRGPNLAVNWLMAQMISGKGWEAVQASPKVSRTDLQGVTDICVALVLGSPVPKFPASKARRTQQSES